MLARLRACPTVISDPTLPSFYGISNSLSNTSDTSYFLTHSFIFQIELRFLKENYDSDADGRCAEDDGRRAEDDGCRALHTMHEDSRWE